MQNIGSVINDALLGLAGDALGVPHEFKRREEFKIKQLNDMDGYGTYNLSPGTWPDGNSLSLCLAEALINGFKPR